MRSTPERQATRASPKSGNKLGWARSIGLGLGILLAAASHAAAAGEWLPFRSGLYVPDPGYCALGYHPDQHPDFRLPVIFIDAEAARLDAGAVAGRIVKVETREDRVTIFVTIEEGRRIRYDHLTVYRRSATSFGIGGTMYRRCSGAT